MKHFSDNSTLDKLGGDTLALVLKEHTSDSNTASEEKFVGWLLRLVA